MEQREWYPEFEVPSLTRYLKEHEPQIAALWPTAPDTATWLDWRLRLGPDYSEILDKADFALRPHLRLRFLEVAFKDVLIRLGRRQREVITLFFFRMKTVDEIKLRTGYSPKEIQTLLGSAIRKMSTLPDGREWRVALYAIRSLWYGR